MVLDGTTEHGDQFMSTRSYLPSEVHWGFTFVPIVKPAQPPSNRHEVDIGRCAAPADLIAWVRWEVYRCNMLMYDLHAQHAQRQPLTHSIPRIPWPSIFANCCPDMH